MKKFGLDWMPLLGGVFLLIYSFTTSPLFCCEGNDSAVFKSMGAALLEGKVLYRDIFDHKGPVLYFIEALGLSISVRYGLFILQLLSLTTVFVLWKKTLRLLVGERYSRASLLLSLIPFAFCINGGNQCEEWMLPFLSFPLYFVMKYIMSDTKLISNIEAFCIGVCFTLVFFIRPNDAVAQIGGLTISLCVVTYKRVGLSILIKHTIVYGILGVVITAIPIFVYFVVNDALYELYYGLIGFNIKYTQLFGGKLFNLNNAYKYTFAFVPIVLLCILSYSRCSRLKYALWPVALWQFLMIGPMIKFEYPLISSMPLIVLSIGFLMYSVYHDKVLMIVSLSAFLFPYIVFGFNPLIKEPFLLISGNSETYKNYYEETDKMLSIIPEEERGCVWSYNLGVDGTCKNGFSDPGASSCGIMFHKRMVQCNRFTFLPRAFEVDAPEADKELQKLLHTYPKWLIVVPNGPDIEKIEGLLKKSYTLAYNTNKDICNIQLFKLKK